MKIRVLDKLPNDFEVLVEEVAAGLSRLYGHAAGLSYLNTARQAFNLQIQHPNCLVLGAFEQGDFAGLLTGQLRGSMAEITFIHVLAPFQHLNIESALAQEAIQGFRAGGVDGIICELVTHSPLKIGKCFSDAGFTRVSRALMRAQCADIILDEPSYAVDFLGENDWPEAAACIVDAYKGHPGRRLHYEVRGILQSVDFVTRVAAGRFGTIVDSGIWGVRGDDGVDGVLAGCSIAPGMGFVLQLAVRRERQGNGVGTALLRHAARQFHQNGLAQVALGVTLDDPAQRLYEKLGFTIIQPVDAFIWWRPGHAAVSEK